MNLLVTSGGLAMELALIISCVIALCLGVLLVLVKQRLQDLDRSIFIADRITKFVKQIDEWQEKSGISPFDKNKPVGIDPHDVYTTLADSSMRGESSFRKEVKKYGDIEHL